MESLKISIVMSKKQEKIEEIIKKLLDEDQDTVVKTILKYLPWPREVRTQTEYFVKEDDNDGIRRGIGVSFLDNGDGIIDLSSYHIESEIYSTPHVYRFRNLCGGGRKLFVHGALLLLALAIKLDPDEGISK